MRIEVLDDAKDDLIAGFHFYEKQSPGLGPCFLDSLFADIDSLLLYAGTHRIVFGSHTGASQADSLSRSTTALRRMSLEFAPSSTVGVTPYGSGVGSNAPSQSAAADRAS